MKFPDRAIFVPAVGAPARAAWEGLPVGLMQRLAAPVGVLVKKCLLLRTPDPGNGLGDQELIPSPPATTNMPTAPRTRISIILAPPERLADLRTEF